MSSSDIQEQGKQGRETHAHARQVMEDVHRSDRIIAPLLVSEDQVYPVVQLL
jgi:hypothetical protein